MKLTTLSVLVSVALFGLVGCASKGSGSEARSAHNNGNVSLTRPNPQPTTNTTANNSINAKPNNNTNANNNTNTNKNVGININARTTTIATAHTIALNDNKAMNITYVARPTAQMAKEIQKVLDGTNRLRAEKGLKPLKLDPNLSAYAQVRASEIAIQFNHQRLSGEGIGNFGENNAGGSATGEGAVGQWRNSKGHYANMVNASYETIGIGAVYDPNSTYKYYWVQIFNADIYNGKDFKMPYEFTERDNPTNPKPLEQLIVNGTTVPLPKAQSGSWQAINANGHTGWVNGYQHSRFGSVGKGNAQTHLFYQGARTDDTKMPKSGQATYNGHALIIKNSTANTNAQSRFTANFGTRKLNGTIHQNNQTLYTLSADINGGAFASKAGASVETQGAFFGQNAEELGGTFKDSKTDTKGVFGAKK